MVAAESAPFPASQAPARRSTAQGLKYLAAAVAVTAVVAIAAWAVPGRGEEARAELLTDSVTIANKILKAQKFRKANARQQKHEIKHMLSRDLEHKSGAKIVSKIANIAAKKHESYHERMEAMKKLLDAHTADIQDKTSPEHAKGKSKSRGRVHKTPAEEAKDNAKAIKDAKKLLIHSAKKSGAKTLKLSAHDKKVHSETSKTAANPKVAQSWMQKQLTANTRTSADKVKAAVKHTAKALLSEKKAIKEGEQLMKRESKLKHQIRHKLSMSSKDQKIHKASEKASLKPSDEAKFFKHQVTSKKHAVKKAAASKLSKKQKLLKWAEAHGLPKKMAENPKDQAKVRDIVARMKADAEVERIQAQMKKDDASVGGIIKGADASAAGSI